MLLHRTGSDHFNLQGTRGKGLEKFMAQHKANKLYKRKRLQTKVTAGAAGLMPLWMHKTMWACVVHRAGVTGTPAQCMKPVITVG